MSGAQVTNAVVIAGTDTNIGKTVFAAALTAASGGTYWKPIQAGITGGTDRDAVAHLGQLKPDRIHAEAHRLMTPCSPHRAAEIDNVAIDTTNLVPPNGTPISPLVIELAGGLMVPLTHKTLQIELLARWQIPVVLCARTSLGTINHTLLSLFALQACDIPVLGVAFIGDKDGATEDAVINFGNTTHLGRMPICNPLNANTLRRAFSNNFDVARFFATSEEGAA